MSAAARIGLLLLGLLALAGAVHAPLHEDGAGCSPLALCAGVMVLGASLVFALWTLVLEEGRSAWALAVTAPRVLHPRLTERGRAPPRG